MSMGLAQAISGKMPLETKALFRTIGILGFSAVTLSAAVIAYFNGIFSNDGLVDVMGQIELLTTSVMPYLISAVIAAITASSINTIIPFFKILSVQAQVYNRLELLAKGDLCSKIPAGRGQAAKIAHSLNDAVDHLASRVSQLKAINHKQWDLAETIRMSAKQGDCSIVLQAGDQMEENWKRASKIEDQLST